MKVNYSATKARRHKAKNMSFIEESRSHKLEFRSLFWLLALGF